MIVHTNTIDTDCLLFITTAQAKKKGTYFNTNSLLVPILGSPRREARSSTRPVPMSSPVPVHATKGSMARAQEEIDVGAKIIDM